MDWDEERFALQVEQDQEWMAMTQREQQEHAERIKRIEEAVARLEKAMSERMSAETRPGRYVRIGKDSTVWVS